MSNVLVTGDVIIDHHLYMGGRTTHDSPQRIGSLHKTTRGGAKLLHDVLDAVSKQPLKVKKENLRQKRRELRLEIDQLVEQTQAEESRQAIESKEKEIGEIDQRLEELRGHEYTFHAQFGLNIQADDLLCEYTHLHGYATWKPFSSDGDDTPTWRIERPLGYGSLPQKPLRFPDNVRIDDERPANVLVLDDAGLGFRFSTAQQEWPAALQSKSQDVEPEWVVLKLSGPLGHGNLVDEVVERFEKRLILVVSVDDIRREQATVTKGISWERTALDLLKELAGNPALERLRQCRHLVVPLRSEGAVWVNYDRDPTYHLIFDPRYLEGEWEARYDGMVFGFTSCLTASIVHELVRPVPNAANSDASPSNSKSYPDIKRGVRSGLAAMRQLLLSGHGKVTTEQPGFRFDLVAAEILNPSVSFSDVELPCSIEKSTSEANHQTKTTDDGHWTIMAAGESVGSPSSEPLYGLAKGVALLGAKALAHVPHLKCGKLNTVDRDEIESLRNIHELVTNYLEHDPGKKPLSLAVFGPPGSGKSFSIKQLAKSLPGRKTPVLEFNLSQFAGPADLIGAFHQVRDAVLQGTEPFVFWDEFDSREYLWLQYLLAPMQDGAFQDGQLVHPIGKCIFIFAGGTSYDMEHFGPPDPDSLKDAKEEHREIFHKFRMSKGPDFKSRLSGYLNVLGPNRRQVCDPKSRKWSDDKKDICFPIRRALFIRGVLGISGNNRLEIDRGVLAALLEIDRYKHGARSLEKVLVQISQHGNGALRRSNLPQPEILGLHVDASEFLEIIVRNREFVTDADRLAPLIHKSYLDLHEQEKWSAEHQDEYSKLPIEIQGDNRAAAARIPLVLELAGLYVKADDDGSGTPEDVCQTIERHIELLAEAEHDGWMEHKLRNGWVYAPERDNVQKRHPALVPYKKLTDQDREKDRNSVRKYPEILQQADYRIARSTEDGS